MLLLPSPCVGGVLVPIMGGPGAAAAVRIARRTVVGGGPVVQVAACIPAAVWVGKPVVHAARIVHGDCSARGLDVTFTGLRRRPAQLVNVRFPALVLPTCLPAGVTKPSVGCCITDAVCVCIATVAGGHWPTVGCRAGLANGKISQLAVSHTRVLHNGHARLSTRDGDDILQVAGVGCGKLHSH